VPADNEPGNNACSGANLLSVPVTVPGLQLPTAADVDWFMFNAVAGDVGKQVHVITTSPGPGNPCDTVIEVFAGASCTSLTTLGGPSDDINYAEDWLSAPIAAAGPIWVKVSYATSGFTQANYSLNVSLQ
jgi:hypothetical protein